VDVGTDAVVVIHGAACVEDDIVAYDSARVDHHAGADHYPLAQAHVGSEHGSRMDGIDYLLPLPSNRFEDAGPDVVITDGYDDGVVVELVQLGNSPQDRKAHDHCTYG